MRHRLRLVLLVFVLLFVVGIIYIIRKSNSISNDDTVEIIKKNQRDLLFREFNAESAKYMIHDMFIDDAKWNSDKYPISQHFKEKYQSKYDISDDFTVNNSIGADLEYANDKGIRIIVDCSLKDKSANKNYVRYHYDCIVDNNGELYDIEYKFKVPYVYTVDEYWGEGYERADGKSVANTEEGAMSLIEYMINPHKQGRAGAYYEYMTYDKLPLTENCKIINKPDFNILGPLVFSYWYGDDSDVDYEHEITKEERYSKDGYPYLIMEFENFTKKYEVKYHVNDEYFFDYIEFVEVKN